MRTCGRLLGLAAMSLGVSIPVHAQSQGYVGGAASFLTAAQAATTGRLGGTTWSGSVVVGMHVSRRLSVEIEPAFGGEMSAEKYTYRPSQSLQVEVAAHGRETFLTVQLRGRTGVLEPVAGVSYVRSVVRKHAVIIPGDRTYFDDESSKDTVAFAGGVDAAFSASPRFAIVPTFRVFILQRASPSLPNNPSSGVSVLMRAGVGVRATF